MGGLPTTERVNAFAVNPREPQVMYVGMRSGLYISRDEGKTWRKMGGELAGVQVAAIAVHPARPNLVYLGTPALVIFKSDDGGKSWQRQR